MSEEQEQVQEEKKPDLNKAFRRKATIFIAVGFISFCLTMTAVYLANTSFSKMRDAGIPNSESARKMHKIGKALLWYSARNDWTLPNNLSILYKRQYFKEISAFDSSELPGEVKTAEDIDAGVDFIFCDEAKGTVIGDEVFPLLRENRENGLVLLISKKGLTWLKTTEEKKKSGQ